MKIEKIDISATYIALENEDPKWCFRVMCFSDRKPLKGTACQLSKFLHVKDMKEKFPELIRSIGEDLTSLINTDCKKLHKEADVKDN